jgi:hypothetical protein
MAVYKRGDVWWFKFSWKGESIRESTKQGNKRVAEQIESARKTQLAKGEVGIRDRKPVPTLEQFMDLDFLPFVRTTKAAKPNTVRFYENSVANLKASSTLGGDEKGGSGSTWAQNWAHRGSYRFRRLSAPACNQLKEKGLDGATLRDRTGDLLITNQPLYQLS